MAAFERTVQVAQVGTATVSAPSASPKVGQVVTISVDLSPAVLQGLVSLKVTGTPKLTVNSGGSFDYVAAKSNPSQGKVTFSYTIKAGQTNLLNEDLMVDQINWPPGIEMKISGQPLQSNLLYGIDLGLQVDAKPPTLTFTGATFNSIFSPMKIGDVVTITITASEAVTVTGTPALTLSNNAKATYDAANSTSTELKFKYVVAANDTNTAELFVKATGLSIPTGSSIKDAAGNAAVISIIGAGSLHEGVDAKAPTIIGSTAVASANSGETLTITLKLSEKVHVTGTPKLTLSDGRQATYVSGGETNTLVFKYTVAPGFASQAITLPNNPISNGTIIDFAGNPLKLANTPLSLGTVDGIAPAVKSVTVAPTTAPTPGSIMFFTLNMSETIKLNIPDSAHKPYLVLSNGGTAYFDSATATTLKFKYEALPSNANTSNLQVTSYFANGSSLSDVLNNTTSLPSIPALSGIAVHTTTPIQWKAAVNGDFNDVTKWTGGVVPTLSKDAAIDVKSNGIFIHSTIDNSVGSFSTAKYANLQIENASTFTAASGTGIKANAGNVMVNAGSTLVVYDLLNNTGGIELHGDTQGADVATLKVNGQLTLKGGGIIAMGFGSPYAKITSDTVGTYINNIDNKISGSGEFGGLALKLINQAKGTIEASSSQHALLLDFIGTSNQPGIQNAGRIQAALSSNLFITGYVSNSGTISANGLNSHVHFDSGSDVKNTSTGVVSTVGLGSSLELSDTTISLGAVKIASLTYLNAVSGHSSILGSTITNAGTISADGGGLFITSAINNTGGTLIANDESLTVTGQVTGGKAYVMGDNGYLTLGTTTAQLFFHADAKGTLAFSQSATVNNVSLGGFAVDDSLVFNGINYVNGVTTATLANGKLTVDDHAGHKAVLALTGDYTGSNFVVVDDGFGHVSLNLGTVTRSGNLVESTMSKDILTGTDDSPTVSYKNSNAGVTINLSQTLQAGNGSGRGDELTGFSNVVGSGWKDTLTGDSNNNKLTGGKDADTLTGGGNSDFDIFHFDTPTDGGGTTAGDTITDFVVGQDRIEISRTGFGIAANITNTAFQDHYFWHQGSVPASEKHGLFIFDITNHQLKWDSNGGTAGGTITVLATFSNNVVLHDSDIFIV